VSSWSPLHGFLLLTYFLVPPNSIFYQWDSPNIIRIYNIVTDHHYPKIGLWRLWFSTTRCKILGSIPNVKCSYGYLLETSVGRLILASRGLPHPDHCVLWDQEDDTAQHILSTCVFARQFCHNLLAPAWLGRIAPRQNEQSFAEERKVSHIINESQRKGFKSTVILGGWTLWLQRNKCVFDDAYCPSRMHNAFSRRSWSFGNWLVPVSFKN
jgi:hypothetical protein